MYNIYIMTIPNNKKIFFIGYNKTATSSIHSLFLSLGYKCTHCAYKWDLERFQVFSDTGSVPFIKFNNNFIYNGNGNYNTQNKVTNFEVFIELYNQYPNAIYVLNTRSLKKWLISRYKHGFARNNGNPNWAWPIDEKLTIKWINDREKYYNNIINFFSNKIEQLIIINIEKPFWQKELLSFLSIEENVPNKLLNKRDKSINSIISHVDHILNKLEYNNHDAILLYTNPECISKFKNNL